MARRHQLEIDGKVLMDIRNTWLPPTVRLTWDDARRTLTLHPRQGSFEGMRTERPIRLILHDKGQQPVTRPVTYDGRAVTISW